METVENSMYSQDEILAAWDIVQKETAAFVAGLDEAQLNRPPTEKWSIAGHFEHLIKSTKPLAQAMNAPKLALRTFGKPNRDSRDYSGLVGRYHERLEGVENAASGYTAKEGQQFTVKDMLDRWNEAAAGLSKGLGKWKDKDLDNYLLPHPLMGKLLVREMLFFTHYHTGFHLMRMRETLDGKWG